MNFNFVLQNLNPQQSLVVRYPISGFVFGVFWGNQRPYYDDRYGYSLSSIFMKLSGKILPLFNKTIVKTFCKNTEK